VFADIFAESALPSLLDTLGDSITYTPAGGDDVSLTAVVGQEERGELEVEHGRRLRREREVTIATDPDGPYGGVAAPALNDTVTIDSESWAVESISSKADGVATLLVVRFGDVERSQEGYRRRGPA